MSLYFHQDRKLYFEHQRLTTKNYIIPFIESKFKVNSGMAVLEIGCGEGGVLKAFTDRGCVATGVDLSEGKLELAAELMKEEMVNGKIQFLNRNIYDEQFKVQFRNKFNLVILKDVIEHIEDQQRLLSYLHTFLKANGMIFMGFPPWYMPFGGHQQMCKNKILSKMPYIHLLPGPIYKRVLRMSGEKEQTIEGLLHHKTTGITIERFERILRKTNLRVIEKKFFLINPIYRYKFKIEPREQYKIIKSIPFFRNFLTTCVYYLIKPQKYD